MYLRKQGDKTHTVWGKEEGGSTGAVRDLKERELVQTNNDGLEKKSLLLKNEDNHQSWLRFPPELNVITVTIMI